MHFYRTLTLILLTSTVTFSQSYLFLGGGYGFGQKSNYVDSYYQDVNNSEDVTYKLNNFSSGTGTSFFIRSTTVISENVGFGLEFGGLWGKSNPREYILITENTQTGFDELILTKQHTKVNSQYFTPSLYFQTQKEGLTGYGMLGIKLALVSEIVDGTSYWDVPTDFRYTSRNNFTAGIQSTLGMMFGKKATKFFAEMNLDFLNTKVKRWEFEKLENKYGSFINDVSADEKQQDLLTESSDGSPLQYTINMNSISIRIGVVFDLSQSKAPKGSNKEKVAPGENRSF